MTMSPEMTADRLSVLARKVALDAGRREDLDSAGKCRQAVKGLLEVLDGKTANFPKCILTVNQSEDDIKDAAKNGEPWFDPQVPLLENLSEKYDEWVRNDALDVHVNEGRAYTSEEASKCLLGIVDYNARIWSGYNKEGETDVSRCEAALFTFMNIMDGTSLASPMYNITLDAEDIASRPELSDFSPIVLDTYLHDRFYRVSLPDEGLDADDTPEL